MDMISGHLVVTVDSFHISFTCKKYCLSNPPLWWKDSRHFYFLCWLTDACWS